MAVCVWTGLLLMAGALHLRSPGTFLAGLSVLSFGVGFRLAVRG